MTATDFGRILAIWALRRLPDMRHPNLCSAMFRLTDPFWCDGGYVSDTCVRRVSAGTGYAVNVKR
jgi:hypothetical protein